MINYVTQVKEVIAEKSGVDVSEVTEESYFEEDLNISEMELIEILEELEDRFHLEIIQEKDNMGSVGDLLDILSEELE